MPTAEHYAKPLFAKLGGYFPRLNDFKESFAIRWGQLDFELYHGASANLKVLIKVYRESICENYLVDTDAYDMHWDRHKRTTRDFYILPESKLFGKIQCIKFAFNMHCIMHNMQK